MHKHVGCSVFYTSSIDSSQSLNDSPRCDDWEETENSARWTSNKDHECSSSHTVTAVLLGDTETALA